MWNSIEGLAKLFYASQWAMAVLGALTALAIVFSIIVSVRKDALVDEKAVEDAKVNKTTIESQNQQISTLNDDLGKARDRLEELTSQRTLTAEQRRIIIEELRKLPGQGVVIVKTQDLETNKFAAELERTLNQGSWRVLPSHYPIIEHVEPGLLVMVRSGSEAPKGAVVLLKALQLAKLPIRTGALPAIKEGDLILWIGPKGPVN